MPRRPHVRIPILSLTAARNYLGRQFDNWDFLKEVPKIELLDEARGMGMRFASAPWQHQLVCFMIGALRHEFLFYLKQGGGKSKIIADLIRYRKRMRHLKRAIILVPELLHVSSWEGQLKEHAPDLSYWLMVGDKNDRQYMLSKKTDICVMNFKGLEMFMTQRGGGKQQIDIDLASQFATEFNFGAFDELHRIVDIDSTYYQLFRWMAAGMDFKYGLTGTPFGRNPAALFGQFLLIDNGETLGQRLEMFHSVFFHPKKDHFKGVVWNFDQRMLPELHRIIKHRSISYEPSEYGDMPLKLHIRMPVRLTGEGHAYYQRIIAGIIEARGDYSSMKNIFVRLRQCASGFIALKADDDTRIEVQFKENPKLDALVQFVKSKDEKILVFHEYTISGRLLAKEFTKQRISYAEARGGIKDVAGQYERFLSDPKCQIFLLNNQTGSECINPHHVCRRIAVYESPVDPKQRDQLEMRAWRLGQKWPVFIHDFTVMGTIEEKIRRYNREGQDLLKAVMSGKEKLE